MVHDSAEDYSGGACDYCGTYSGVHLDGCPNQYQRRVSKRRRAIFDEEPDADVGDLGEGDE